MTDLRLEGIGMTSRRTRQRLVDRLRRQGIGDERVLRVMLQTPRHLFVDEALASRAYEDTALPIGFGQTISQPYTVARMTELLLAGGRPGRVLEVGTGCGYQAAVLAPLVGRVFSIERISALADRARRRLRRLGLGNVRVEHGDGYEGWPDAGPFDGILVTAAPPEIPRALAAQLAPGGRLLLPVGDRQQQLLELRRDGSGFKQIRHEAVSFVPMRGGRA